MNRKYFYAEYTLSCGGAILTVFMLSVCVATIFQPPNIVQRIPLCTTTIATFFPNVMDLEIPPSASVGLVGHDNSVFSEVKILL